MRKFECGMIKCFHSAFDIPTSTLSKPPYRIKMLKHPFVVRGIRELGGEVLPCPVLIVLAFEP